MDWMLVSKLTLTFLSVGIFLTLPVDSLRANGTHVCNYQCHRLQWRNDEVLRPCGFPSLKQKCAIRVRRPVMLKQTCYECCAGWRNDGLGQCTQACLSGVDGIISCHNLTSGWYQLCDSCRQFARCEKDGTMVRETCPLKLVWDDKSKYCVRSSRTCKMGSPPESNLVLHDKLEPAEDIHNELTNKVEISDGDLPPDCSSVKCPRTSTCIMIFSTAEFQMQPKCICPAGTRLVSSNPPECTGTKTYCTSSPCQHGRCHERRYGYKCECDTYWRGRNCNKPTKRGKKELRTNRRKDKRKDKRRRKQN